MVEYMPLHLVDNAESAPEKLVEAHTKKNAEKFFDRYVIIVARTDAWITVQEMCLHMHKHGFNYFLEIQDFSKKKPYSYKLVMGKDAVMKEFNKLKAA